MWMTGRKWWHRNWNRNSERSKGWVRKKREKAAWLEQEKEKLADDSGSYASYVGREGGREGEMTHQSMWNLIWLSQDRGSLFLLAAACLFMTLSEVSEDCPLCLSAATTCVHRDSKLQCTMILESCWIFFFLNYFWTSSDKPIIGWAYVELHMLLSMNSRARPPKHIYSGPKNDLAIECVSEFMPKLLDLFFEPFSLFLQWLLSNWFQSYMLHPEYWLVASLLYQAMTL